MEIRSLLALLAVVAAASARTTLVESEGGSSSENATAPAWWRNCVFYEVYPRSFRDTDGDGIGDIRGVIEKLPYLKELGICGVWLSPIFKSPMVDMGYDIEDFYEVDPIFGTMKDIEDLFAEAKKLEIRVILDFVPNHSSDKCKWFEKSIKRIEPYTNYYVWKDGKKDANGQRIPPTNWVRMFGAISIGSLLKRDFSLGLRLLWLGLDLERGAPAVLLPSVRQGPTRFGLPQSNSGRRVEECGPLLAEKGGQRFQSGRCQPLVRGRRVQRRAAVGQD